MGRLDDLAALEPIRIWDGVIARSVDGERAGFAVVELEPATVVPEHSHDNEQLGMVLSGSVSFRVGDEVRDLQPGGTLAHPAERAPRGSHRTRGRRRHRCIRTCPVGLAGARAVGRAAAALALDGVPIFHVVLHRSGPEWDPARPLEEQSDWPAHAAFMDGLVDDGFVVLGGPLADEHRVVHVIEAKSENEIRARLAQDPWSASHLRIEAIDPWTIRLDARG